MKVTIVVTCGREGGVEAKKREWGDLPECGTVILVDLTAMTLVLTISKSLSCPSLLWTLFWRYVLFYSLNTKWWEGERMEGRGRKWGGRDGGRKEGGRGKERRMWWARSLLKKGERVAEKSPLSKDGKFKCPEEIRQVLQEWGTLVGEWGGRREAHWPRASPTQYLCTGRPSLLLQRCRQSGVCVPQGRGAAASQCQSEERSSPARSPPFQEYSRSPMYERVPFWEHVHKSNLFVSPTKLA